MACLRTLDVSGTNKIYYLPKTMCYVRTLEALILPNPNLMEYPPPSMYKGNACIHCVIVTIFNLYGAFLLFSYYNVVL